MEKVKKRTIGVAFDEVVDLHPEKEALIYENQRITYRQLQQRANQFAKGLMHLGMHKGDKISVWMNNNPEWVYAFLGSAKAGTVFVSVNNRFKSSELEYLLQHSDSTTVLFKDRVYQTDFMGTFQGLCPEISSSVPGKLNCSRLPLLRNVIVVTEESIPGAFSVSKLLEPGSANITDQDLKKRQNSIQPEDLAMFQYTSGTTSFPKGCMLLHGPIARDAVAAGHNMAIGAEDRVYCPLPFCHVGGSIITLLSGLLRGATIVTSDHFDPEDAMEIIQQEKCTVMNGVESIWLGILNHPKFKSYDLHTLQKGWATGPVELLRSLYERMGVKRFVSTYGLSEATANTGMTLADDPLELKLQWNGQPHPDTEMKIVDQETGKQLPPGREGEICVRGYTVMKGYYKMPEETAKAIDSEGWLHTGDLGIMNEKGYFKFSGRLKDMLRVGGENVAALEVEGYYLKHPAVRQAQVIGIPDEKLVEVPALVVQLKEGQRVSEKEMIDFAKGKLSNFKIPRYVWFVDEFTLTASGKIQKFKLKEEALKWLEKGKI